MDTDILVIGGGVIGCAVARELSRLAARVTLLERASDVAEGASKANSGIVHAGFDAKPGSRKAELNVRGSRLYEGYCREVGAPYARSGALVLAFDAQQREHLDKLLAQGCENGVQGLRIVERAEALALEPNLNPEVLCALLAPTSGLCSPYELTCALADQAAVNGVSFHMDTEAQKLEKTAGGYTVTTNRGVWHTRVLVNCAGVFSAALHNQLSSLPLSITPRKGEYYLLDHEPTPVFSRTLFQTPTSMGKGVLVSPTVHQTMLLGPSAQDAADPLDVSTTAPALSQVLGKAALSWPGVSLKTVITTFAGMRAHEAGDDFIVGATQGAPGAYEAVGIESPGLTAAPAIAEDLLAQIETEQGFARKTEWLPAPSRPKPFSAMSEAERRAACEADAANGVLVCRCEQVTEAEVRAAIRRPVGARTLDAVKRRTRAGMGRCQGGFCSPRVMEILAEELGMPLPQVTKCGGESRILDRTLAEAARGDA